MQFIELIKQMLVGKKVNHKNKYSRVITLEVEDVKLVHHSRQITASTAENDWWPESVDWKMVELKFVDGSSIEIDYHTELKIES